MTASAKEDINANGKVGPQLESQGGAQIDDQQLEDPNEG